MVGVLLKNTKDNRAAIFARYRANQGKRPVSTITGPVIEQALYTRGGWAAVNEYKALKPVFEHLRRLGFIKNNPLVGIELDRPKIQGFPVADADDIATFQKRWPVGSRERLVFDLALYTGAARVDWLNWAGQISKVIYWYMIDRKVEPLPAFL